jgi:hypothetical protein
MTQSNYNRPVYVLDGQNIEKMTYADYLREYFADETTSPCGVEPRLFIREHVTDTDDDDNGDENGFSVVYQLRRWNPGGSSSLIESYDTEEEAEHARLQMWEAREQESNTNAPVYFYTEEEAQECLDERFRFAVMDRHTGEIISRHETEDAAYAALVDPDDEFITELNTQV